MVEQLNSERSLKSQPRHIKMVLKGSPEAFLRLQALLMDARQTGSEGLQLGDFTIVEMRRVCDPQNSSIHQRQQIF